MQSATITLHNAAGLHARPAAIFVKMAATFQSTIQVILAEKTANAKSIVHILTLGAKQGSTVTLTTEGPDEEVALQALIGLIEGDFSS